MCTLTSAVLPGSGAGGSTTMLTIGDGPLWQPRQPLLAMPLAFAHAAGAQPPSAAAAAITVMYNRRRMSTSLVLRVGLGRLGFGRGGHDLDPLETLLLSQAPLGGVEDEGR